MKFRRLRADEIDCRISTVKSNGVSILLYKDARCDMNILDETVGAENWQRRHELINGNLFCSVGIYCPQVGEWVWKQDVGTESYTEKEKGQASDSFKRACFNWGIGRELYTAPFLWVPGNMLTSLKEVGNGKWTCYDRFVVDHLDYDQAGRIRSVSIINERTKRRISFCNGTEEEPTVSQETVAEVESQPIGMARAGSLMIALAAKNVAVERILTEYKVEKLADLTEAQHSNIIRRLEKSGSKGAA